MSSTKSLYTTDVDIIYDVFLAACSRPASQHSSETLQQERTDQEGGGETSTKDKHNLMDFPVRGVAEQLTRLDAVSVICCK